MVLFALTALLGLAAAAPQIKPANVTPQGFRWAISGFTTGPASNSTVAQNALPAGAYNVTVDGYSPAFPGRTVYFPTSVPNGTTIPVVAWVNGNCYIYGNMYRNFLIELASQGYMIVAPGAPSQIFYPQKTQQDFIGKSIDLALDYARYSPLPINTKKVAVAGHGCGGFQATEAMAYDEGSRITTGIFFNVAGSNSSIENFSAPSLWIAGGPSDPAPVEKSFQNLVINDKFIPTYKAVLNTGSAGTFWLPRGGAYAEAATKWLDLWLKNDQSALAAFPAPAQLNTASARGWVVESNAFPSAQRTNLPPQ